MSLPISVFLLTVLIPGSLAVTCYDCEGVKIKAGANTYVEGTEDCIDNYSNVPTKECPGDLCVKIHYEGQVLGTDVKGVTRGCDEEQECIDGLELTIPNEEYPDLKTIGSCSSGDLSNGGVTVRPVAIVTAVLVAMVMICVQGPM